MMIYDINNIYPKENDHLLFLSDINHLEEIKSSSPFMLQTLLPITGDMEVSFELESHQLYFIDEWDFLTPKDVEENKNKAHLLAKSWWDENLASTEYKGLILSDLVQQDLVYPFEASLNARTVYSKLFETHNIKKISGFFLRPIPVIRTGPAPTTKAVQSVSQAILFYMAEQQGVTVNHLRTQNSL